MNQETNNQNKNNMENKTVNGQLLKKILISGEIEAKTGLHIGGTNAGLSIGGADATVVRNPINNQPYIPGSSLKGKMRSMLEKLEGAFNDTGIKDLKYGPYVEYIEKDKENYDQNKQLIIRIFGTVPEKMKGANEPTSRLIVRDCELINAEEIEKSGNTDMPYTEVKTEVVIDRVTSAATPRQLERVPAGAKFKLELILNVYHGDNESLMLEKIFESLILVQNDYLGGKGTRGSGEVKINLYDKLKYKDKNIYENNGEWNEYNNNITIPTEIKKNNTK